MSSVSVSATGGCLCGAVSFEIRGSLRGVVACHCSQCRRTHGHFAAYTQCRTNELEFTEDRGLKWYVSSDQAKRGFCQECGASLFWQPAGASDTSVSAGCLNQPSRLRQVGHIYCDDIADYYTLSDELPKYPGSSKGAFRNGQARLPDDK